VAIVYAPDIGYKIRVRSRRLRFRSWWITKPLARPKVWYRRLAPFTLSVQPSAHLKQAMSIESDQSRHFPRSRLAKLPDFGVRSQL